jgi:hypothetical protein
MYLHILKKYITFVSYFGNKSIEFVYFDKSGIINYF